MANTLSIKRSAVAGKVPLTSDLALGELAINTYDGKLFMKRNVAGTETIIDVTAGGIDGPTVLSLLSDVDGAGSGLDADRLDGQQGSYYRNATNLNAGTLNAARLPSSGVTAGSYGSATAIPVLTVDDTGRVTAASTTSITVGDGTLTVNTSGTGLSGSGTFTANQSGNGTITIASNATNLNTASTIVARDASGNFAAGTITGALSGNASSATVLQTARTIALSGDVSGSASFNGGANVTITATVADDSHNHVISNVDGLQAALDGKAASSHTHTAANITDFAEAVQDLLGADIVAGTGLSVSYNDTTGDTTITNTAPDQVVALTGAGATSVSGTYPNFTISSTDTNTTYTAGSGLTLTGTTFSHTDTSSQASVNNSGAVFIQDVTLDTYGHVTGLGSVTITPALIGAAASSHSHAIANVTGLQAALDAKLETSLKGAVNGLAELDATGRVPAAQLPSYVDDVLEYANEAGFPATGEAGKLYVALDVNDVFRWSGTAYIKVSDAVSSADQATKLATARTITLGGDLSGSASFDGTANITISATVADDSHNHTIANVDGLQTALNGKSATSHVHSAATTTVDGFMSAADKTKLDGVAAGAQVNVATNLTYSTAASSGTVNSSTGTNATIPAATTSLAGLLTGADKTKLDGIAAGAQVNVATNLGYTTAASTGTVTSSTGANATLPAATTTLAGLLTGADKTKLDGIAAGAQVNVATNLTYTSGASTGTVNSSTGANATIPAATTTVAGLLTGADKTKLDGIAAGAQVNVATNLSVTGGTTAGPVINSSTGTNVTLPTASDTASGVVTTGAQTFAGVKTFSSTISGSVSGNAATATALQTARTIGGVSFNGTANINLPGVNTAGNQSTSGNAATATTLQTARTINGTSFNGSANITTANWGTARTLTIGNTGKSVNGSGNVAWSLAEIGALAVGAKAADSNLLDGYDYTDFNGVVARWINSGSNATGRLKLKLPFAANSGLMLKFTISQYTSYGQHDYEVAAYLYSSTNQWYLPTAVYTGTGSPSIIVGREADGKAYVSIADDLYTGVIVHSLTIGYIGTEPNAYDQGWVITQDATTPNSVSVDVRTTLLSSNYNSYSPTLTGVGASGTWGISVTGNAATATALQTARTIGGVSFNGTANINLPGVNTAGNQSTSGNAATATTATNATNVAVTASATASAFKVPFANTTASTTGNYGLLQDSTATFTYNPSTNTLTVGTVSGALSGNATTATTLQTARTINGTSFNGSGDITTANWGTARTLTIGSTGKSVNGSANVAWTLAEIGAAAASHTHTLASLTDTSIASLLTGDVLYYNGVSWVNVDKDTAGIVATSGNQTIAGVKTFSSTITGSVSGNAGTATTLQTARTINGTSFNGSANITTANWGTARTLSFTGDVTGSASVNGSANVATAMTLANSGATAGTYTNATVTVDAKGRVTSASSGTSGGLTVSNDTATTTARFVTFTGSSSGSVTGVNVSSARLTFVPSTGALTASGAITANSDIRLKSDIALIPDALSKVQSLRGVTFTRDDLDGLRQTGVIAQEVEAVLPEAVHDDGTEDGIKSVAYGNMVGLLIEAIKEQQVQIDELKALLGN